MLSNQLEKEEPPEIHRIGKDIHIRDIDPKTLRKREANESDYQHFFKHSVIILDEKRNPIIIYLIIPELPEQKIIKILNHIDFGRSPRFGGLMNAQCKVFGYEPRNQRRKDFCSATRLKHEDPSGHETIENLGKTISKYYEKYAPTMFKQHNEITKSRIKSHWIIEDTPFTSGIINKNNPLKYHYDGGNFNNVYSNMIAFKKDCEGGYLSIPHLNIGLEIANKSLLFFDGQKILHGVTPFKLRSTNAYRYTLVYYSLKGMWQCQTLDEELERIKRVKTTRELFRYKLVTNKPLTVEEEKAKKILEQQAQR